MKTLKTLSFTAVVCAYGLIVLGAVVRITDAGLGCGDNWPLCNGRLIPPLDDAKAVLEWTHRLVALALSALTVLVAVVAVRNRRLPGGSGPDGTIGPALAAAVLLLVQVLLGAVTVWLELPPVSVVLHLGIAMALLAALLVTGLRTGCARQATSLARGSITSAAGLALAVILLGGLTANLGAGPSCQGFPLCNGQIWPASGGSGLPHVHWMHRLLAYALFLHLIGVSIGLRKRTVPDRLRTAVWSALGITIAQVIVAAAMVLSYLPPVWRGVHVAVGTAVWVALVYAVWLVSAKGERVVA
jgi:heme A synthase